MMIWIKKKREGGEAGEEKKYLKSENEKREENIPRTLI